MRGDTVIPGGLDWRAQADLHRPTDRGAVAAEIRRLVANGLKPRDVAAALRLGLGQVLEALRDASPT